LPPSFSYACQAFDPTVSTPAIWYNQTSNTTFVGSPASYSITSNPSNLSGPFNNSIMIVQNAVYTTLTDSLFPYRLAMIITGCFWIGFGILSLIFFKVRPGKALPSGQNYCSASFRQLAGTFKQVRKFPNAFLFCVAWFVYADSFNTIATVASLFISVELKAPALTLAIVLIEVPLVAIAGVYFFEFIRRRFNIRAKSMIFFHLASFFLIGVYMCIGFIPASPFGMKSLNEIYGVAAWYGLHLGSIQTFSRATFSLMVPKGKEAVFFSLYALSDKGSSWIGPLVSAALNQAFGSMRYAVIFIMFAILVACPILWFVDVEKGQKEVTEDANRARRRSTISRDVSGAAKT